MKRIGVIGAGRFGLALSESLTERGAEVLLLDRNGGLIQRTANLVARAVQGDATDEAALRESGFDDCDTAVVAIGSNMEGSILATMSLKELGVPYIVAKAATDLHAKVLERVGAHLVVCPNRERAQRLARSLLARSPLDYFEISKGVSVVEMEAPETFLGKTLVESKLRGDYDVTVLAIKRKKAEGKEPEVIVSPGADDTIQENDTLVLFGPDKKLEHLS